MRKMKFLSLGLSALMAITMIGCGESAPAGTTTGGGDGTAAATESGGGSGGETANTPDYIRNDLGPSSFFIQDTKIELSDAEKQKIIADHTDANGKTFVTIALVDDPGSLCAFGSGASKVRSVLLPLIYQPLFARDKLGMKEPAPVIGESWEYVGENPNGGFDWTVKIKENVYDSAGNHITADDVVFSIWEIGVGKYNAQLGSWCTNMEVVDDYTFKATMTVDGFMTLDVRLLSGNNYVFSRAAYEASPDGMITSPVGTGPYALTKWETGSTLTFEKNENAWWVAANDLTISRELQNVDKINFKVIKDSAQRTIALEAGEIDYLTSVEETDLVQFQDPAKFTIADSLASQRDTLYFNASEKGNISDVRVRQAICYAIDNEAIILGAVNSGVLCYTVGPTTASAYNKKWETEDYYNYNPDKARELLKEAGIKDGELTVVIMTENAPAYNTRVAEIIQGYLEEVGVKAELKPVDGALFSEYKYDPTSSDIIIATTGGNADYLAPSYCSNDYRTKGETTGLTHLDNPEWTDLQERAMVAGDGSQLVEDCHYYIKDNVYGYALFSATLHTVVTPVITEVRLLTGFEVPGANKYLWNE